MSIRTRAAAVAAAALVLGVLLAGCGGQAAPPASPSPSSAPTSAQAAAAKDRIELGFMNGAATGGVQRFPIKLGTTVELVVTSDVADEVHVHGYDKKVNVAAGGKATLTFVADVAGVFEVEMEKKKAQLAQLEVR